MVRSVQCGATSETEVRHDAPPAKRIFHHAVSVRRDQLFGGGWRPFFFWSDGYNVEPIPSRVRQQCWAALKAKRRLPAFTGMLHVLVWRDQPFSRERLRRDFVKARSSRSTSRKPEAPFRPQGTLFRSGEANPLWAVSVWQQLFLAAGRLH